MITLTEFIAEQILTLSLLYAVAWGVFLRVFTHESRDPIAWYRLTAVYFLAWTWGLLAVFPELARAVTGNAWPVILAAVIFMPCLGLFAFVSARRFFPSPETFSAMYSQEYGIRLDGRYLVSRASEIAFQQTAFILLFTLLRPLSWGIPETVSAFMLLFFFLRLPFLRTRGALLGGIYVSSALVAGAVFPLVLWRFGPFGIVVNIILHWLFTLVSAIIIRAWCSQLKRSGGVPGQQRIV